MNRGIGRPALHLTSAGLPTNTLGRCCSTSRLFWSTLLHSCFQEV
ncbi:unnamed protein product [Timema podura]|uniref:Uncharacterized protein n=1 Tax=Timema podura TaxID=61482 RepID=A0ABN7NWK4_TIMPD|nr:unnamed protein product [Timema podura]